MHINSSFNQFKTPTAIFGSLLHEDPSIGSAESAGQLHDKK